MSRILAFSGSARRDSFNQQLATAAARHAEAAGADVTLVSLRDFPMPLFNQDEEDEHGQPEAATALKALFVDHDGLLIASPEYNGSITPLLKNTLDWLSRRNGEEPSMIAYKGKTAAIMGASAGGLGGLRGLVHVRAILSNLGVLVIPKQFALRAAHNAFDDSGDLKNERDRDTVVQLTESLVDTTNRMSA